MKLTLYAAPGYAFFSKVHAVKEHRLIVSPFSFEFVVKGVGTAALDCLAIVLRAGLGQPISGNVPAYLFTVEEHRYEEGDSDVIVRVVCGFFDRPVAVRQRKIFEDQNYKRGYDYRLGVVRIVPSFFAVEEKADREALEAVLVELDDAYNSAEVVAAR